MKAIFENVNGIRVYKVPNDKNGNGRMVVFWLDAIGDPLDVFDVIEADPNLPQGEFGPDLYEETLKLTKKIGGKRYTANWFGGGIVFQSNCAESLCRKIELFKESLAQNPRIRLRYNENI